MQRQLPQTRLPELREMILAAYGALPADKLAAGIASALQAAQAAGRYDLAGQSDA